MTEQDVPLWRLNVLRAFYLLVTVGLATTWGPSLLQHTDSWAQRRGELGAMLMGLGNPSGSWPLPIRFGWPER